MKLDQTDRLVLSILVKREKYSLEILAEYKAATGKELPVAVMTTTLTRLEAAELIADRMGEEPEGYFNQRRKYFAVTEAGYKLMRSLRNEIDKQNKNHQETSPLPGGGMEGVRRQHENETELDWRAG